MCAALGAARSRVEVPQARVPQPVLQIPERFGAHPPAEFADLARGRHALRAPADLKHHALLRVDDRRDWGKWLAEAGIADVDPARGLVFNQAHLAIDAAVGGQGVALARTALATWDLLAGRLVRPFALALKVPYAYWIVCPKTTSGPPKICAFRDWLLAEAAEESLRLRR
ncbi:MAG: hypothetical protein EXR02_00720 [Rhodospirillales bacterium]|nr:hypothetical protein [Rhodospirillales bacterium]MSP79580.1 hypothetical protein [Rhodospirillales bacterium]